MKGKKYTKEDLSENKMMYNNNLQKLKETINTPGHDIYVEEERRLEKRSIRIRESLDIPIGVNSDTFRPQPLKPSERDPGFKVRRDLCKEGFSQKLLKTAGI